MMISRFCKDCGSKNTFDDSKEKFFCSICGAVNQVDRQNTSSESSDAPSVLPEDKNRTNIPVANTVQGFVPLSVVGDSPITDPNGSNNVPRVIPEQVNIEETTVEDDNSLDKAEKKNGNKIAKTVAISISALIGICLIAGAVFFFIKRIPSKYYGSYVSYYYIDGVEQVATYKISALSIKYTRESNSVENQEPLTYTCNYTKKGDDLIIVDKSGKPEYYLILDDDCLYIDSSKDISLSKKYGLFYWNVKSDKADIYEIERRADGLVDLIEETVNTWTREEIYSAHDKEMKKADFYISRSDEETDETDLFTYEIQYKAAGGDLSLYFDKSTKEFKRAYFSGFVDFSSNSRFNLDQMSLDDFYDSQAMLISLMYILGNKENVTLNTDENDSDYKLDYAYRLDTEIDAFTVFASLEEDPEYNDRYTSALENNKYRVSYSNWITLSDSVLVSYSVSKN